MFLPPLSQEAISAISYSILTIIGANDVILVDDMLVGVKRIIFLLVCSVNLEVPSSLSYGTGAYIPSFSSTNLLWLGITSFAGRSNTKSNGVANPGF